MKFALLGLDDTLRDLVASLAAEHAPVAVMHDIPGPSQTELAGWFPDARHAREWDELLALDQETIVIVARGESDDLRAEQLRKLLQQGRTLVVSHPVLASMVVLFELEMIRSDSRAIVLPWTPERTHPGFTEVQRRLQAPSFGKIEQLSIERPVEGREAAGVLRSFARDMHVARAWTGEITKVAALTGAGDFGNLVVQMSGPSGTIIRWSAISRAMQTSAKFTLVGAQQKLIVEIDPSTQHWTVDGAAIGPAKSLAQTLIDELSQRLAGTTAAPTWLDACRDAELADAVDRSAVKGKTIELYLEDVNEENTFKGMMAAGGCFLLLFTLPLIVLATTFTNLELPLVEYWPYGLLLILAVFLVLQTLRLAFPVTATSNETAAK
ncbi:MAG: hypothetical protein JNM18_19300 [Planctomycetaceae bacterium]|nr:hypothetical protein [Planctomycetaceae bacterium]